MDELIRDYSDMIDMELPSLKVPLSRKQYLAFEAVLSGKKLLDMGEEIWLREYAPEDYKQEVHKTEQKQEEE